jgi:hypothetical protein
VATASSIPAGGDDRALRGEDIVHDAERREIGANERHHLGDREVAQRRQPLRLGRGAPLVAVAPDERGGRVLEIGAGIKSLGDRIHGLAERLAITQMERARERLDLGAGIVDVVFAADRKTRFGEQRGERIADDGAATMADMHRAGRIGRDILDIDGLACAHRRSAIGRAGAQHFREPRLPEHIAKPQIEEAGAGDRDRRHVGLALEPQLQFAGERARRDLRLLREHHRRIGREVAVRGIARRLDRDAGQVEAHGQFARAHHRLELGDHQAMKIREQIHVVA